ncbi:hypothetical protein [Elizabethkingia anophelis]|nr:hypothetical protein [Elizabethkingia anophelis]MCT3746177.1 hypothetical protein [Elizabethkingia anophelis]MCT4306011.1 hypothetical protein [Elizabethkingia anophelis]MDC8027408.1 hypothetical protein [Elizabethkingia anophelis]CDN74606.1 hypothetical protein E18064_350007 [Elizabethkingia anophelis]CDN79055.1 hypothetical protein E27107_40007 [Elizabethkingia anophelis]
MKTIQQYINKFGLPTPNGTGYLVTIDLPFPLRIVDMAFEFGFQIALE